MRTTIDHTQEERGLIATAQAGDERAFMRLVEPHRRALEVHCYRMLGSIHDAQDLVQETLMRAWQSIERFERRSSVSTWLYRIATNACLDELERRPRRPEPVDPYPDERLEQADAPIVDPAARYAMREGVELAFLTAIQKLPGRQRATLILRDVLGWTASEAAELLDSTVASSNSALQRARAVIDGELPATSATAAAPSHRALLAEYIRAWDAGDMDAMLNLLRNDATMRMPPQRSVVGAKEIVDFFENGPCLARYTTTVVAATSANGRPAISMRRRQPDGSLKPHGILVFQTDGDRIAAIDAFIDERLVQVFSGN